VEENQLGPEQVGMQAETCLEAATFLTRIDGFWRAEGFPLSDAEKLKTRRGQFDPVSELYALRLEVNEARGLLFYINHSCIANAFNDYRNLANTANCDLVTTWFRDETHTPTFRASVETNRPIAAGEMCHVDYGDQRLLDMQVFAGGKQPLAGQRAGSGDVGDEVNPWEDDADHSDHNIKDPDHLDDCLSDEMEEVPKPKVPHAHPREHTTTPSTTVKTHTHIPPHPAALPHTDGDFEETEGT
jgi:hypothetical protein